jgi:hypothetical protein
MNPVSATPHRYVQSVPPATGDQQAAPASASAATVDPRMSRPASPRQLSSAAVSLVRGREAKGEDGRETKHQEAGPPRELRKRKAAQAPADAAEPGRQARYEGSSSPAGARRVAGPYSPSAASRASSHSIDDAVALYGRYAEGVETALGLRDQKALRACEELAGTVRGAGFDDAQRLGLLDAYTRGCARYIVIHGSLSAMRGCVRSPPVAFDGETAARLLRVTLAEPAPLQPEFEGQGGPVRFLERLSQLPSFLSAADMAFMDQRNVRVQLVGVAFRAAGGQDMAERWLTDLMSAAFKVGGERWGPREFEEVLREIDEVLVLDAEGSPGLFEAAFRAVLKAGSACTPECLAMLVARLARMGVQPPDLRHRLADVLDAPGLSSHHRGAAALALAMQLTSLVPVIPQNPEDIDLLRDLRGRPALAFERLVELARQRGHSEALSLLDGLMCVVEEPTERLDSSVRVKRIHAAVQRAFSDILADADLERDQGRWLRLLARYSMAFGTAGGPAAVDVLLPPSARTGAPGCDTPDSLAMRDMVSFGLQLREQPLSALTRRGVDLQSRLAILDDLDYFDTQVDHGDERDDRLLLGRAGEILDSKSSPQLRCEAMVRLVQGAGSARLTAGNFAALRAPFVELISDMAPAASKSLAPLDPRRAGESKRPTWESPTPGEVELSEAVIRAREAIQPLHGLYRAFEIVKDRQRISTPPVDPLQLPAWRLEAREHLAFVRREIHALERSGIANLIRFNELERLSEVAQRLAAALDASNPAGPRSHVGSVSSSSSSSSFDPGRRG